MNIVTTKQIIGVCGLICSECRIYNAPNDPEIAKELVDHFNGMWENVKPEDFHCSGCRGNINETWSPDCWIRKCCIEKRSLDYCYECQEFPCHKLQGWSMEDKGYKEALERLKELKL